jgi:mannosyltransferase OCH1-like enzyme
VFAGRRNAALKAVRSIEFAAMAAPHSDLASTAATLALMQYWDTPEAPAQVEELMATWSDDRQFVHHRYSWDSARAFVGDHFDQRTLAAFEACAVPAMQCDVFRLCWLFEVGGIYVDADQGNRSRNEAFTDRSVRAHLYHGKKGNICNGLMSFFERHDPLVGTWLDRVCSNVESRQERSIWHVTGPGVITKLYAELGQDDPLFQGVRVHDLIELAHAVTLVNCDYKSLPTHWSNVRSIYRSGL